MAWETPEPDKDIIHRWTDLDDPKEFITELQGLLKKNPNAKLELELFDVGYYQEHYVPIVSLRREK